MDLRVIETVAKTISKVLQLDRLERMCKYHPTIAMMNAGLICDINSILLEPKQISYPKLVVGPWALQSIDFDPTLEGKLQAMSHVFKYRAEQMCAKVDITNIADFVKGLDPAFDLLQEILKTMIKEKITVTEGKRKVVKEHG